jgi:hypothetical protein
VASSDLHFLVLAGVWMYKDMRRQVQDVFLHFCFIMKIFNRPQCSIFVRLVFRLVKMPEWVGTALGEFLEAQSQYLQQPRQSVLLAYKFPDRVSDCCTCLRSVTKALLCSMVFLSHIACVLFHHQYLTGHIGEHVTRLEMTMKDRARLHDSLLL